MRIKKWQALKPSFHHHFDILWWQQSFCTGDEHFYTTAHPWNLLKTDLVNCLPKSGALSADPSGGWSSSRDGGTNSILSVATSTLCLPLSWSCPTPLPPCPARDLLAFRLDLTRGFLPSALKTGGFRNGSVDRSSVMLSLSKFSWEVF